MNTIIRLTLVVCGVVFLVGCATTAPRPAGTPSSADPGYFLSLQQKKQLIGTGRIQDSQGRWYDVWIVPGYVTPARRTWTYLKRTGNDFAEYVQPDKYRDLARNSGDAFEWAYDDCLYQFTVKGVPRAWGNYFDNAQTRSSRRVFGWWLAYPWALLEGTVDTAVRIPVGLAGTVLGTAWGGGVVPGYYMVNSTAKGTWHFAADSVLFPVVGCTWNTVIAPPLALVGQKPAPSRSDGFWVKELSPQDIVQARQMELVVSRKDLEDLTQWGRVLLSESREYTNQLAGIERQNADEFQALYKKTEEARERLQQDHAEHIRQLGTNEVYRQLLETLQTKGYDVSRTGNVAGQLRNYLENQSDLSPQDKQQIQMLLRQFPPTSITNAPLRLKTDPLQNSIEIIKHMD